MNRVKKSGRKVRPGTYYRRRTWVNQRQCWLKRVCQQYWTTIELRKSQGHCNRDMPMILQGKHGFKRTLTTVHGCMWACPKEHNLLSDRQFPVVAQTYFGVKQTCREALTVLPIRQKTRGGREERRTKCEPYGEIWRRPLYQAAD